MYTYIGDAIIPCGQWFLQAKRWEGTGERNHCERQFTFHQASASTSRLRLKVIQLTSLRLVSREKLSRIPACPGFGWSRLTKGVFPAANPKNWRILDLKTDFAFLSANPNSGFLIRRIPFEKGFTGFEVRRIKTQISGIVTYDVPFTECIRN